MCNKATYLSGVERYFCFSNLFSRPISCSSVNTVRLLLPFLALLPCSDTPLSSLPRRCSSRGRWWAEPDPPWRPELAASSAELMGEPRPGQDRWPKGNLKIEACSAFSRAVGRTDKALLARIQGYISAK